MYLTCLQSLESVLGHDMQRISALSHSIYWPCVLSLLIITAICMLYVWAQPTAGFLVKVCTVAASCQRQDITLGMPLTTDKKSQLSLLSKSTFACSNAHGRVSKAPSPPAIDAKMANFACAVTLAGIIASLIQHGQAQDQQFRQNSSGSQLQQHHTRRHAYKLAMLRWHPDKFMCR